MNASFQIEPIALQAPSQNIRHISPQFGSDSFLFFTSYPNPSNISTGLFVVRSVSNLTILDLSNNPLDHKSAEIIETFIGRSPKIQSIKLLFSFSFFLSSLIFSSSSSSSSFYLFC